MTVDLDKPGKQVGFVMIPHSTHDDAWGVTRLPIAVISNGKGPTVIIEGGTAGVQIQECFAARKDLVDDEIRNLLRYRAMSRTGERAIEVQPVDR